MEFTRQTEHFTQEDLRWLPNWHSVVRENQPSTIVLADFVEATHYPEGVINSGTFLGKYTSGTYTGFWGPWDKSASDGRQNLERIVYSGFTIKPGFVAATQIAGATVMPNATAQIEAQFLPAMLDNGAAYVPVQADLPAAWLMLDE